MPIIFPCPGCSSRMRVSRRHAGKQGRCPHCAERVQIPTMPGKSKPAPPPVLPTNLGATAELPPFRPPTDDISFDPEALPAPPSDQVLTEEDSESFDSDMGSVEPDQQIGRYTIQREIARGGMGVVYQAHDPDLDRRVAIKQLLERSKTEANIERFRREARAVAMLQHPNIVRIYDIAYEEGTWYMVMDLVEGESLGARLDRVGALPAEEAAKIALQAAQALHYAHTQQILHRDVKPANILISNEDEVKLTDFGLAKVFDLRDQSITFDATPDMGAPNAAQVVGMHTLTASGKVMGTPMFMSPEQAKGEKLSPRSDVYSLGATLYNLLTGYPPFMATRLGVLLRSILKDAPEPPSTLKEGLSPELERICLKCLAKKAKDRYPTAEALANDLAQYLGHGVTGSAARRSAARKGAAPQRRRISDGKVKASPQQQTVPAGQADPDEASAAEVRRQVALGALGGALFLGAILGMWYGATSGSEPEVVTKTTRTEKTDRKTGPPQRLPPAKTERLPPDPDDPPPREKTLLDWVAALDDPDATVRLKAVAAVNRAGRRKGQVAIPKLRRALTDDDERVRDAAARALGTLRATEAIPALARALNDFPGAKRAQTIAKALEAMGAPAIHALYDASISSDPDVRGAAGAPFVRVGALAIPALVAEVRGSDRLARRRACRVIGQLGSKRVEAAQGATRALIEALGDGDSGLVARAASALGDLRANGAVSALARLLGSGNLVAGAAETSLRQIGKTATNRAAGILAADLCDPSEAKRANALRGLRRLKALAQARVLLEGLLKSRESYVRATARRGLDYLARGGGGSSGSGSAPIVVKPRAAQPLEAYAQRRTRPNATRRAELAVTRALEWLARHQREDGRWSAEAWQQQCRGTRCQGPGDDKGAPRAFDTAITSLAVLAFQGHGHTHRGGKYQQTLTRALSWLMGRVWFKRSKAAVKRDEDGLLHHRHGFGYADVVRGRDGKSKYRWKVEPLKGWPQPYNQALLTQALADAYSLTQDASLREPLQGALDFVTTSQNPLLGWGYGVRSGRNNTSITCWMLQALLSAQAAGIEVAPKAIEGAYRWLKRVTSPAGRLGYASPGGAKTFTRLKAKPSGRSTGEVWIARIRTPSLTAHGLFLQQGWFPLPYKQRKARGKHDLSTSLMRKVVKLLGRNLPSPKADDRSFYYWHFGTYAMTYNSRAVAGVKRWRKALHKALLPGQHATGCLKGSWDATGEWCAIGGRVYATALNALTLQAPYRLYGAVKKKKKGKRRKG